MRRVFTRSALTTVFLAAAIAVVPGSALAQRHRQAPARPAPPARVEHLSPAVAGRVVFVGGYFYDPFFGPYPWWPAAGYPYAYYPAYDSRALLRVMVTPKDAAVYVDGFYAGIVDDFNGYFQGLPLSPGGHEITIFLEGYRTLHEGLYLAPGSTTKFPGTLERLPAGVQSEPPRLAPPVPPPPANTFSQPRTPARTRPAPPHRDGAQNSTAGTLDLRVQPSGTTVSIDGNHWTSSDGEHFVVQLTPGPHHIEVSKEGYVPFSTDVRVAPQRSEPLNVSLTPAPTGERR
jgi:hypothetical protein